MAKPVDMELKKAFTELQQKMIETKQKLRLADMQIDGLKRQKQHAEITEREVNSLQTSINTYESVGRMFILTDMGEVKVNLKKRQNSAEDKIKSLENSKNYLERSLKDFENNIREMVLHKKHSADS